MRTSGIWVMVVSTFMALSAPAASAESPPPANRVEAVRFWTAPDHTRVVLDMSSECRYEIEVLTDPHRIAINVLSGKFASGVKPLDVGDGVIERIRINRLRSKAQVVLDLSVESGYRDFALKPIPGKKSHRIVVDVERSFTKAEVERKTERTRRIAESGDYIIILDPGHGGFQPGACSRGGLQEKSLVLRLAKMIEADINARPGFRAVLTREGDYLVGRGKRIAIARDHKGDCFVSLHMNSHESSRPRGSEVYFLSLEGATDENAERVAERENLFLEMGEQSDEFSSDLKSILFDIERTDKLHRSSILAQEVASCIRGSKQLPFRGVKQANFVVLRSIAMPSVLVEGAFLSNRKDEKLIRKESVLRGLAEAITEGIFRFFEKYPPAEKQIAMNKQIIHVVMSGETLWGIARKYNVTVREIRSFNGLGDRSTIKPGQKLKIYR